MWVHTRESDDGKGETGHPVGIEQREAKVVFHSETHIVLKVPGRKYSFSAHPTMDGYSYAPAEFQVYAIESTEARGSGASHKCQQVATFPVR